MVPALKTPRPKHALGGVLSKMRGEILRQGPGCGPSLYDPLTGDSRGGDVGPGAIRAMIETCADRKTGVAMLPLTFAGAGLPRRMDRARPDFPCLLSVPPGPGYGGAFLPCQGFAVAAVHR